MYERMVIYCDQQGRNCMSMHVCTLSVNGAGNGSVLKGSGQISDAAVFFLSLQWPRMRLPEGNPRGGNESSAFTGNLYSLTTMLTFCALTSQSCNCHTVVYLR